MIQPREAFIPNFHPTSEGPSTVERLLLKIAQTFPDLLDQMREAGAEVDEEDVDEWRELSNIDLKLFDDAQLDADEGEEPDNGKVPEEKDPAVYWRGAVRTGQGTSFRTQRKNQFIRSTSTLSTQRASRLGSRSSTETKTAIWCRRPGSCQQSDAYLAGG